MPLVHSTALNKDPKAHMILPLENMKSWLKPLTKRMSFPLPVPGIFQVEKRFIAAFSL